MVQEPSVLSILLSTFDSEKFLDAWFKSMIQQSIWNECEIVIVANEPTPSESHLLQNFVNKYREQVNLLTVSRENLYASWNRALEASSGKYLAIANVDDVRTPDSVRLQIAALENDPDVLFSYGSFQMVSVFGESNGVHISPPEFDKKEFTRSMHLGPFFVWRRTKDQSVQFFDEQFKTGGDFDFAIRLALAGRGVRVEDNIGYYYDGGTGLSTGSLLQPIERTVIELRYGIYDKIDYHYLPKALKYRIYELQIGNRWVAVENLVPNYAETMSERYRLWFDKGLRNYANLIKENRGLMERGLRKVKSVISRYK